MAGMTTLIEGRLIRRYKRFLADVELADGGTLTVHCPNTGAMTGCAEPGSRVWLSRSDSATRKYPHTWELVETAQGLACIHSARANKVVRQAIETGLVPAFADYPEIRSEVKYGEGSRADLVLAGPGGEVYIEVKSVTLCREGGWGAFPDAVSTRGARHLRELAAVRGPNTRAVMFFCAFHTGVERVCTAGDIDPAYREALMAAQAAGVEVMAWGVRIEDGEIQLDRALSFAVDSNMEVSA